MIFSQAACSTYQARLSKGRSLLTQGQPAAAAAHLKPFSKEASDDQLVYLLDYAVAEQAAGNFKASTNSLLRAEKIAEINDYHSISKITGSMLLNEGMIQYKGENYEKLLINLMLALNFLSEDNLESALVETRKLNLMLDKMIREGKKKYEYHPFAHYLAGMIWEESRSFDDAFIDYKKAYDMAPNFFTLQKDLLRAAYLAKRWQSFEKIKKQTGVKFDPKVDLLKKNEGEVVLIFAQGWAPRKRPDPRDYRMPWLFPVRSQVKSASLSVANINKEYRTRPVYHVQNIAMKTFSSDYAALLAKRIAARIAKREAAKALEKREDGLGSLALLAMTVADQADLRQWSTLPETIQMVRMKLPVGENVIKINTYDNSGGLMESSLTEVVNIKSRKKTFIYHRSFL